MKVLLETMRKRRNLNQRELSERSGVPQPMISEIERGIVRNPQIGTMYKLAKALKCTIDDLIENTEKAGYRAFLRPCGQISDVTRKLSDF